MISTILCSEGDLCVIIESAEKSVIYPPLGELCQQLWQCTGALILAVE